MYTQYHANCGGTVLSGGSGEQRHHYCDRCGAFTHDLLADLPAGTTDKDKNQAAWDAGEEESE